MALILINPDERNAVARLTEYATKDGGDTAQYLALAALELLGHEAKASIPVLETRANLTSSRCPIAHRFRRELLEL